MDCDERRQRDRRAKEMLVRGMNDPEIQAAVKEALDEIERGIPARPFWELARELRERDGK